MPCFWNRLFFISSIPRYVCTRTNLWLDVFTATAVQLSPQRLPIAAPDRGPIVLGVALRKPIRQRHQISDAHRGVRRGLRIRRYMSERGKKRSLCCPRVKEKGVVLVDVIVCRGERRWIRSGGFFCRLVSRGGTFCCFLAHQHKRGCCTDKV